MFNGLANMARLMANPKAAQDQAQEMRTRLAEMQLTANSAEGHVQVVATGDHRIISVTVSEQLSGLEKSEIEQHILSACSAALDKARQATASELATITQHLGLPGLDKFLQL